MNQISLFTRALIMAAIFFTTSVQAQKQTNFWFFGLNAGLDFNPGTPSVITTGSLNTTEGCSAISDANGNLLFYTDGVSVWNKNNVVMPNGTGLQGDPSTTQSALIIKKPGSSNLYYIFTLPAEGTGNFCYSVVDMTLDSGNGDVTTKNTVLKNNVTEKLAAVHNCNGTDIWVMVHEYNSNGFYAYPVTSAGVGTTAVVSNVGRVQTRVYGQMKFSNDGTKLACCRDTMVSAGPPYQGNAYLDVFSFNNSTGAVASPTVLFLNNWQKTYGCEFSKDNSKLYATYYDLSGLNGGNSEVIQYNLTATNVAASGVTVGASFDPDILRAMQLGPDGKIYISKGNTPFLCCINAPNAVGAACNYSADVLNVDPNAMGTVCMLGLPGFYASYFNANFPALQTCTPTGIAGSERENSPVKIWFSADHLKMKTSFEQEGQYSLTIFNLIGSRVFEQNIDYASGNTNFDFNLPSLPSGIYVVDVSGHGISARSKIFKQ